jgi:cysteine desulfurase / selenocysteine lyase
VNDDLRTSIYDLRMIDWSAVRAEYPAATRYTYLNSAGAPPVSRRAASEARRFYSEMMAEGDLRWPAWLEQMEGVRARVARLLGAEPAEVAFTFSSSHAFTLLAQLLGPAAHVVAMADEFPSATLPFLSHGDDVTFVPSDAHGEIAIDAIADAITETTRAVVTSSVMYATGFRQDLAALGTVCRRRRVPLLVDATQSAGVIPIDVRKDAIDALVFSGYKWTTAGYGVAAMYVSRDLLRMGAPPLAGWWSARDPEAVVNDRLDLKETAAVFELGCPHFAGIFALGGSLSLFEEIGQPAMQQRVEELTDYLHARAIASGLEIASPRERARRAGITIIRMDDAAAAVDALTRAGVIVSARGAGVRVATHVFNTEEDLDRCVAALSALARGESVPPRPVPPSQRVACVDLNGVLDRYAGWKGAEHWDLPAPGAREFLRALHQHGWRVIVFTTRHYAGAQRWLAQHGMLEYVSEVTDIKPPADVFVDDRAIGHRGDFAATLEQVLGFSAHWEPPPTRSDEGRQTAARSQA